MNGSDQTQRFSEINPFPSTAVAQVSTVSDVATISTPAIQAAVHELEIYLGDNDQDRPGSARERGRVLAIVGDYGTGKTHLAVHLMNIAQQWDGATVQQVYLNAPADTFTSLYRAFAVKLKERRDIVTTRVRQFYAGVVADNLEGSKPHADIVRMLREDDIDPIAVVQGLNLAESTFLEQVQVKLRKVTDNNAFGSALTLLLRPGFEDAVWEWFLGNEPDEILRERGITEATTANERSALDAMGVFALLIGHDRFRFMVVVDELDQLLSAANRPPDEVQAALKHLLRVFLSAGAFLVLAGLPEFLTALRSDVQARITTSVTMTPLRTADAVEYIRLRQFQELGTAALFPFTEDTVEYIVDVAGGSPRRIISLCYHLYRRASDQGSAVSDAMVRTVVREHVYGPSVESMHRDIRRVLRALGLEAGRDRYVDTVLVNYRIPVGNSEALIALLVSDPVLDDSQLRTLIASASQLQRRTNVEVLVIFGGYVSPRFADRLREALSRDPLVYELRDFADQLDAELKSMMSSLERLYDADPGAAVLARVERLSQQQSNVLEIVLQLAGHLESFAASSEQRIRDLARQIGGVWPAPAQSTPETGHRTATGSARLPDRVAAVFDDAVKALSVEELLSPVLDRAFDEAPEAAPARRQATTTLREPRSHSATGVATLLRVFTESFRNAVTAWYQTASADGGRLLAEPRQRLEDIFKIFETLLSFLPAHEVSWMADQLTSSRDAASGLFDDGRLVQVQDVFAELSARVRASVLDSFGAADSH
jgi:type II secretory pathway predicted ATPase ExeA